MDSRERPGSDSCHPPIPCSWYDFQSPTDLPEAAGSPDHVNAENNIKNFLVLHEIGVKENLTATDADIDAEIKKMAEQYKMKEEDVRNIINKNLEDFRGQITDRKVREFIMNSAVKKEGATELKEEAPKAEEKEAAPKKAPAKKTATAKKAPAKKAEEK